PATGAALASPTARPTTLAACRYPTRFLSTDAAGNSSTTGAISVVIDNTAPTAGTLAFAGLDDTGSTETPAITKDGTFDLSLTGQDGESRGVNSSHTCVSYYASRVARTHPT